MLDLDTALELNGVTLYADHGRPNHYYYLPGTPRIARDRSGWPLFELLVYRGDALGDEAGGFLTMTVDLGISEGLKERLRGELRGRFGGAGRAGGEVTLAPLPIDQGSVRISALSASTGASAGGGDESGDPESSSSTLVEDILGSARPSSYGDNRAVFSMELSRKGAQLMEASLRDPGASQIAVVYELSFTGLMPARQCTITVDYSSTYEYLHEKATTDTLWFESDVDRETERMITEGSIVIDDKDFLGLDAAAVAARATALHALAKELAQWTLFKPSLKPGTVLATDRGALTSHDPAAQAAAMPWVGVSRSVAGLGYGQSVEDAGPSHTGTSAMGTVTRANGEAVPTEGEASGEGDGDGASGGDGDGDGDGGGSDAADAAAGSGVPSDGTVPEAVARWNDAGRPRSGYLLRTLEQEERQTITYELRQAIAVKRTIAPQGSISVAARGSALAGRIKRVDLGDPFFERIKGTVRTATDFQAAGLVSMQVKIRYGEDSGSDEATNAVELQLTGADQSHDYAFYRQGGREMSYQVVANYRAEAVLDGGPMRQQSPWITTTDRNPVIDPRVAGDAFDVRVLPGVIDWGRVEVVEARLEVGEGESARSRNLLLRQGDAGQRFLVRSTAVPSRRVALSTTFHTAGGPLGPVERVLEGSSVAVLGPPSSLMGTVEVYFADPLARLERVLVELTVPAVGGVEAQHGRVEVGAGTPRATWSFIRSPEASDQPVNYRHRITVFAKEGSVQESEWQEGADGRLVVGNVAEDVLHVPIVMAGDPKAAGYMSVMLLLQHPDVAPWADAMTTMLLQDASPQRWTVPLTTRNAGPYTWTATWVTNTGQRRVDGPHQTHDPMLLLIPPQGEG